MPLIGVTSGGNPYYYVTDNQGAPSALVDNSGAKQGRWDYSPTGNARSGNSASVDQPFGYTGAYLDSSGLYKMGARYTDPTLGRFTQPDPSGQENNSYAYASGDPINRSDPSGLASWDILGPAGDITQSVAHLAQGDTQALWGDVAGVIAGAAFGILCESVMVAGTIPTGGVSDVAGTAACYAGAWGASQVASSVVSGI
ncbi:RHS repeat-associated core domain-containing protein [Streptomyces sp. BK022]|uniref:RHS repeat-associated core domain-containing protein n=1 Tax=Streptomyces sp. BK022 TaxID=2512123 RepID=UPI0013EEF957|nr:RHS repeat-associated core domain-containing protein [Streptomyces sp. BK022]